MQCGCPNCGLLMALANRGMQSECICPSCGYECSACLGTNQVLSVNEIKMRTESMISDDDTTDETLPLPQHTKYI